MFAQKQLFEIGSALNLTYRTDTTRVTLTQQKANTIGWELEHLPPTHPQAR